MNLVRFNFLLPGIDAAARSDYYRAAIEMCRFVDGNGFTAASLDEHHGVDAGWNPSPLTTAGLVLGATTQLRVSVNALLVTLQDPLRIAEDIAVLDLAGGGRLTVTAGLGYRPSEYETFGTDWATRGALMDDAIETILKAWSGEPFQHRGVTVRVTPTPMSSPEMLLLVGGSAKVSARRAARFGLWFSPSAHLPELEEYYAEQCRERGVTPVCFLPPADTAMLHVAEDPDKAWAEVGEHFLNEARTYADWQTPDLRSAVFSQATTIDALRAEGIYKVVTPDECIAKISAQGAGASFCLHPFCGGIPIDVGWSSLQLFVDQVVPAL